METCNGTAYIIGEGDVKFKLDIEIITISCKHAPGFKEDVISMSKLLTMPFQVNFSDAESFSGCHIYKKGSEKPTHTIKLTNGLYPMPPPMVPKKDKAMMNKSTADAD